MEQVGSAPPAAVDIDEYHLGDDKAAKGAAGKEALLVRKGSVEVATALGKMEPLSRSRL